MRRLFLVIGLIALLAWPSRAGAQSLAAVAKAEEARRKAVKTPAKVYTNDDLRGSDGGSTTTPAPPAAAATTGATPADAAKADAAKADAAKADAAKPAAPDDPKKDEKYWHDRVTAARDALTHDTVLVDAMQSRINALNTDFTNASDPAQQAVIGNNRRIALAELDRLTKDIEKQNKALTDIQEEARKASVPPGWIR